MKKHHSLVLALTCALLALPSLSGEKPASAQDDWNVRRNPFDKGIIARHKRTLHKRPGDTSSLSKLMGMYRRYRSVGLLIREYEAAQKKSPHFSNLMILGHLHQREKNPKEALAYFEKAAAKKPQDSGVNLALGKLYQEDGNSDKAREHYASALKNATPKTGKSGILRALADLSVTAGDIDKAKFYFNELISLDPKNKQLQLELGEALAQFKRFDEAIVIYRKTEKELRSDPTMRIEVITRIGAALVGKGEDMAAVAEYERGIQLVKRGYYLGKELTLRIVEIYRRRQELSTLISKLEKTWKAKSRGHFEWDTLGKLYEETGKPDKAVSAYSLATKKAPYELETHRRLIALLENSGQEKLALKQYEAVIRVAPGEPRFQLELAKRYWKNGDAKKAMAMAKQIESHFSSDGGVVSSLADMYSAWNKLDKAMEAYQKLVRIEPSDMQHIENLGEQYFQRGDKKKAQQTWKKLMRIKNAESYGRLARVYSEHDLLPDGLDMYNKAIRLAPKNSALFKGRANVYERMRKWTQSVADWEMVLSLSPDKASYQSARREARRRVVNILQRAQGNLLSKRITGWKARFENTPPDIGAGHYLVHAYNRTQRFVDSTKILEKLLALQPTDVNVMQQLVKMYRANAKHDQAIELLLKLAKLSPGSERDYYTQIAEIKTDLQQDEEAIEYVQKALDKSPNDPVAYQRLAERYQAMQKQGKAVDAYKKVIELSPRSFRIYFTLARLYINRGQRTEAALLYRSVLQKASDNEILRKAGQEAVELEWLTSTLPALESVVSPLVVSHSHKAIYRRILVKLLDRYVPQLVAELSHADSKRRKSARVELNRLGTHGLRPLLEALADDSDAEQQEIAVSVLGYLGNYGAAAPLVRLAQTDTQKRSQTRIGVLRPSVVWKLRIDALIAAGRLGDPRIIPDLVALSSHKELAMREAAVFALGMTGDKKAMPALLKAAKDSRESVQTLACLGMSEINDPKAMALGIAIVRDESLGDLPRAACAYMLGRKKSVKAQEALIDALSLGNDETQRLSAWALGQIGNMKALPALMTAYFSKQAPLREATASAIERVLSKASKANKKFNPMTGQFPMASLIFDAPRAIQNLVPTTKSSFDSSLLIGQEKIIAAGLASSIDRHRDLVLQALGDLDSDSQKLALGALSANRSKMSAAQEHALEKTLKATVLLLLPQLEGLTQHRDPEVRRLSLRIVAKLGAPSATSLLLSGLSDTSLRVRQSAMNSARLMAALKPKSSTQLAPAIIKALQANAWQERVSAAKNIGEWPTIDASSDLIAVLNTDNKGFVRAAAAQALGKRGAATDLVLTALKRAASETNESLVPVRVKAVKALHILGGTGTKEFLYKLSSSDSSSRVRVAAEVQ